MQVLIYDEESRILMCIRKGKRKLRWVLDIGICGMLPFRHDKTICVFEEVSEEIGLDV